MVWGYSLKPPPTSTQLFSANGSDSVYNNINWESDLLYQIAPEYPQGNYWLGVLGIRSMCQTKYTNPKDAGLELKQNINREV
jgi:hypothetical protein